MNRIELNKKSRKQSMGGLTKLLINQLQNCPRVLNWLSKWCYDIELVPHGKLWNLSSLIYSCIFMKSVEMSGKSR